MRKITMLDVTTSPVVKPKQKVAAYIRVSTSNEDQLISLEAQRRHYKTLIEKNNEWQLVDIYSDEGITGTKKDRRPELLRLISDCEKGKIDFILTKSISRFARNTIDCLELVRKLIDLDVHIYFEKENINTNSMESELMLSILSRLAKNESVSLSENSKWSIRQRFKRGTYKLSYPPYGYDYIDEQVVVNEEQAQVVKRIFNNVLEGVGTERIARQLNEERVPTKRNGNWTGTTIRGIIKNEKYTGDVLLQKTYTVDFLTKKRVINNGHVPQYYVENNHEAIIPREIYLQVQEEMMRRANIRNGKTGKKRVYSSKYALSSIVFCKECEDVFRRVHWNNRGYRSIVWRCVSRLERKTHLCNAETIREDELHQAIVQAINEVLGNKDNYLNILIENIETVMNENADKPTSDIDEKLEELQMELLRLANSKEDYDDVAEEIYRLRELKQEVMMKNAAREGLRQRVEEMARFLKEQPQQLETYDDLLVRCLIEKITIRARQLTIAFKSGIEIETEV